MKKMNGYYSIIITLTATACPTQVQQTILFSHRKRKQLSSIIHHFLLNFWFNKGS